MKTTIYNVPKDTNKYVDEFVVFFTDRKDPKVLYHSIDPESAYDYADKITKGNRTPIVVRITDRQDRIFTLSSGLKIDTSIGSGKTPSKLSNMEIIELMRKYAKKDLFNVKGNYE